MIWYVVLEFETVWKDWSAESNSKLMMIPPLPMANMGSHFVLLDTIPSAEA